MHLPRKDPWLLLLHQIPPKPNSFRVKIWRRLQRLGAVADPAKSAGRQTDAASQIKRLRKRFTEIAAIDFFTAPGSPPD